MKLNFGWLNNWDSVSVSVSVKLSRTFETSTFPGPRYIDVFYTVYQCPANRAAWPALRARIGIETGLLWWERRSAKAAGTSTGCMVLCLYGPRMARSRGRRARENSIWRPAAGRTTCMDLGNGNQRTRSRSQSWKICLIRRAPWHTHWHAHALFGTCQSRCHHSRSRSR